MGKRGAKGSSSLSFIQIKTLAQETADEYEKGDINVIVAGAMTRLLVKIYNKLSEQQDRQGKENEQ